MPLEAVESPRLYRQIADQLRGLIDRREFPVGSRLPPERELAEKLGVSRPSVREALIALEVEGRVRIRMGSGVYVLDPRPAADQPLSGPVSEGPFELLKARELIESGVCFEAAGLVEPQDIARIDAALTAMEASGLSGDDLVALDRAFHVAIAGILHNAVLSRFVGELFDQRINPYFQQLARYFENADSWRAAVSEHRAIRDALAGRDGAGARDAMRRHLQCSQERFSQSFGETQVSNGQVPNGQVPNGKVSNGKASVSARPERQN